MNNFIKISGLLLIFAGLAIIVFALWRSYDIFTGKFGVPAFFQTQEETKNTPPTAEGVGVEVLLQKTIQDQLKGLLPADSINKSFNLVIWSILAMILMSGGSKISDLGIKMIKAGQEKNEHV